MTTLNDELLDRASALFERSRSVLFITGAGISADSGVPTYRGVGGLYEDAVVDEGVTIETAVSGWMMRRNPALTWKYLAQIEKAGREARFNRAHSVIAAMEAQFERVWTLTQNVDGFHHAAGSKNVIEIHGNIHQLVCPTCGARRIIDDFTGLQIPPPCLECEGVIRPEVVLFGEMLPSDKVRQLEAELAQGFDLIVSIGTSSGFPYISDPIYEAKARGIPTIEINPGSTEVSDVVELRLQSRAAMTMDAIWSRVQARRPHGFASGGGSQRLSEAIHLRESGRLDEAKALLLSLAEQRPDDPDVLYQCAWVHDRMGLERAAIPFYERAIERGLLGADLQGALLGLGSTYRCLGDYAKAEATLRRACVTFPQSRALEVFLAMTLHNLGRHDEAMEILLRNLAETSTDESIASYRRAIAHYAGRLGEIAETEAEKG